MSATAGSSKASSSSTSLTPAIPLNWPLATPQREPTKSCFLDITATHEGRGTLLDAVRRAAQQLFVPFTVGGGIRTADEAAAIFDAGADKISINSAALARPELIGEIGARFGAQAVVVAIDARRVPDRPISEARSLRLRRPQAHRPPRRRVGPRGRIPRRRRNPAHLHGLRRHARRLRLRTHRRRQRSRADPGHRLGRRRQRAALHPGLSRRQGRRCPRRQHLSLRHCRRPHSQRRAAAATAFP